MRPIALPTLVALLVATTVHAAEPPSLVLERKVGHLLYYKGTVLVEGVVERRTDAETVSLQGDGICFIPEGSSRERVPREGDARAPWFCFSDGSNVRRALGLPLNPTKGSCGYRVTASVVIGNYVANRQEADVVDTAALVAVRRRGVLRPITCQ